MRYIYKDNILKIITKEEILKLDLSKELIDIENEITRDLNGYEYVEITEPKHIYKFEKNTLPKAKTSLANRVICPVNILSPENLVTYIQNDNNKEVEKKIIKYNDLYIQKAIICGIVEGVYERKTKSNKLVTSLLINTGLDKPVFVTIFGMSKKQFEKYLKKIVRVVVNPSPSEYNGNININLILSETTIKKFGEEQRVPFKKIYLTEISHQEFFDYLFFCKQNFKLVEVESTETIEKINNVVNNDKKEKEQIINNSEYEKSIISNEKSNTKKDDDEIEEIDDIFDDEEELDIKTNDDFENIDSHVDKIIELINSSDDNKIELPDDFILLDEETINKVLDKVKEKINKNIEYDGLTEITIK